MGNLWTITGLQFPVMMELFLYKMLLCCHRQTKVCDNQSVWAPITFLTLVYSNTAHIALYTSRNSLFFVKRWREYEGFSRFLSWNSQRQFIFTVFFALSACGLTCTEHSRPCWNGLWLHGHSIPGMPSSLYKQSLNPELIAYWYWWWGECVKQEKYTAYGRSITKLKPGIAHWHHM